MQVGARIKRAESPNDHPTFIKGLAGIVHRHLTQDPDVGSVSSQLLMTCPLCTRDSCRQTKKWLSKLSLGGEIPEDYDYEEPRVQKNMARGRATQGGAPGGNKLN